MFSPSYATSVVLSPTPSYGEGIISFSPLPPAVVMVLLCQVLVRRPRLSRCTKTPVGSCTLHEGPAQPSLRTATLQHLLIQVLLTAHLVESRRTWQHFNTMVCVCVCVCVCTCEYIHMCGHVHTVNAYSPPLPPQVLE